MKAILIDPHNQSISSVDYDGDYKSITKLIRAESGIFTIAYIDDGDLYVDDEGLFVVDQLFFLIEGCPQPLAGCGLLLSADEDGETVATTADVEDIIKKVTFMNINQAHAYAKEHGV